MTESLVLFIDVPLKYCIANCPPPTSPSNPTKHRLVKLTGKDNSI